MNRDRTYGFTLIETVIATGVLSILLLMAYGAAEVTLSSTRVATAEMRAQTSVRATLEEIGRELELGAGLETAAGFNGVAPVRIFLDGVEQPPGLGGDLIVFQIPLDATGAIWSTPIQYRFVNEDANGNGLLDPGEDAANPIDPANDGNDDGLLTRRIVREQDGNGDGDFDDPGERRVVGSANDVSAVQFQLGPTGDMVTITLSATTVIEGTSRYEDTEPRARQAGAQVQTRVYLAN